MKLIAIVAGAVALTATPAFADIVDIDLSGWQTNGGFGDSLNTNTTLNIGAGSQITAAEWINLQFTANDPSWRSELVLSLNNSAITAWWDSTVSADNTPGSYSGSGTFPGPAFDGGPFAVGADGLLYIETYEAFDDADIVDANISAGTLRVTYSPIPEPASLGVLGLGGLFLLRRRR